MTVLLPWNYWRMSSVASTADALGIDNYNVSIQKLAGEVVALTETPLPVRFNPETLETMGVYAYQVGPRGQFSGNFIDTLVKVDLDVEAGATQERRRSGHRKRSAPVLGSAKPWAAMTPVDTFLKS
jgi:hypothetical protein